MLFIDIDQVLNIFHHSFDEITLSILTSPNAYGINVEVQVDDIRFVGHTLGLENNENLKSFAIFFALRVFPMDSICMKVFIVKRLDLCRLQLLLQSSYPIRR